MKNALIIVSVFAGLLLIGGIFLGIGYYRQKQKLSSEKIKDTFLATLPVYANNADALEAGLTAGANYKTPTNEVKTVTAA